MFTSLTLALALSVPGDTPVKKDPPAMKELFATEDWYKSQEGKEQTFEGILKYTPRGKDIVGFGRFNPFRLNMVVDKKPSFREVYVGGKDDLLRPYADKPVRITGKSVDMEVEGAMHREIWPARIELISPKDPEKADDKDKPGEKPGREIKILGRGAWRAAARPGGAAKQLVIRSEDEFAKLAGADAKTALANLQKVMKVDFDWKNHMLIVVSGGVQRTGGYRVEVTGVSTKDDTMTVRWKLHAPAPGAIVTMALTHPAESVLVDRFEGKVVFDPPAPKPAEKKPGE